MPAAHHQVVFEVVALRTEVAQRVTDHQALAHHRDDDGDVVDAQHATGEFLQAEQVQQRRRSDHRDQVAQGNVPKFGTQLFDACDPIDPQHSQNDDRPDGVQHRHHGGAAAQVRQRSHVRILRHHPQPQPGSKDVGQEHQQRVGEYVQSVQLFLIASYHDYSKYPF